MLGLDTNLSLRNTFGPRFNYIRRYLTELTSSLSQYYAFSSAIVLANDFDIEWKDNLSDDSVTNRVLGENAKDVNRVEFRPGNIFRLRIDGTNVDFSNATKDGKLRSRGIRKRGNDFTYTENGVDVSTVTNATAGGKTLTLDVVGQSKIVSYFNGIISDLLIKDNGTTVADMPLNGDGSSDVERNRAAVLGSEQATDPTLEGNITNNGDSTYTFTTGVTSRLIYSTTLSSTNAAIMQFTVKGMTAGSIFFSGPDIDNSPLYTEDGVYRYIVTPSANNPDIRVQGTSAFDGTVSNISIKEIPLTTPYATRTNLTSADSEVYSQTLSPTRVGRYFNPTEGILEIANYAPYYPSRNFTKLTAALSQYYELTSPITLNGSTWEWEVTFATSEPTQRRTLIGSHTNTVNENLSLALNFTPSSGTLKVQTVGHTPGEGTIVVNDGKLHTAKMVVNTSTGVIDLYVDGVLDYSTTHTAPAELVVARDYLVGARVPDLGGAASTFWNEDLINVVIKDAGTTVLDLPLDSDGTLDYEVNRVTTFGSELWANPTVGSEWTNNNDGSFTLNGTGAYNLLSVTDSTPGKSYLLEFDYQTSGGPLSVRVDDSTGVASTSDFNGTGSASVTIVANDAGTTQIGFARFNGGQAITATVSNITLKEIPSTTPYATRVNMTSADTNFYSYLAARDWLGPNLITQSVWENPSSVGNQWTFANNQWSLVGDGSNNALTLIPTGDQPDLMRLSGSVAAISGNPDGLRPTSAVVPNVWMTTPGRYSFDFTKADAVSQVFKRRNGSVNATLERPSLNRILEIA